jgi:hypothetical protein
MLSEFVKYLEWNSVCRNCGTKFEASQNDSPFKHYVEDLKKAFTGLNMELIWSISSLNIMLF